MEATSLGEKFSPLKIVVHNLYLSKKKSSLIFPVPPIPWNYPPTIITVAHSVIDYVTHEVGWGFLTLVKNMVASIHIKLQEASVMSISFRYVTKRQIYSLFSIERFYKLHDINPWANYNIAKSKISFHRFNPKYYISISHLIIM